MKVKKKKLKIKYNEIFKYEKELNNKEKIMEERIIKKENELNEKENLINHKNKVLRKKES